MTQVKNDFQFYNVSAKTVVAANADLSSADVNSVSSPVVLQCLDSGACRHCFNQAELFDSMVPAHIEIVVAKSGQSVFATGQGNVTLHTRNLAGEMTKLVRSKAHSYSRQCLVSQGRSVSNCLPV